MANARSRAMRASSTRLIVSASSRSCRFASSSARVHAWNANRRARARCFSRVPSARRSATASLAASACGRFNLRWHSSIHAMNALPRIRRFPSASTRASTARPFARRVTNVDHARIALDARRTKPLIASSAATQRAYSLQPAKQRRFVSYPRRTMESNTNRRDDDAWRWWSSHATNARRASAVSDRRIRRSARRSVARAARFPSATSLHARTHRDSHNPRARRRTQSSRRVAATTSRHRLQDVRAARAARHLAAMDVFSSSAALISAPLLHARNAAAFFRNAVRASCLSARSLAARARSRASATTDAHSRHVRNDSRSDARERRAHIRRNALAR
eukprot:19163-Pelagococcus_subviridis.AAC.2